jgi:hypothetical protein
MLSPAVEEKSTGENLVIHQRWKARFDGLTVANVLSLALVATGSSVAAAESSDPSPASSASSVLQCHSIHQPSKRLGETVMMNGCRWCLPQDGWATSMD